MKTLRKILRKFENFDELLAMIALTFAVVSMTGLFFFSLLSHLTHSF